MSGIDEQKPKVKLFFNIKDIIEQIKNSKSGDTVIVDELPYYE